MRLGPIACNVLSRGKEIPPGTEIMFLFASESDRMDYERERATDPMDEWREAMRADHFDPCEFFTDCEEHGQSFDIRTGHCTECPEYVPAPLPVWEGEEPPF